jgi:hypothetical protein
MCSLAVLSTTGLFCRAGDLPEPSAEKYTLHCGAQPGRLTRVKAELEVGGDIRVLNGAKTVTAPLSVQGSVQYDEKLIEADPKALTDRRSIRFYTAAQASIRINKDLLQPTLRPERALIGAAVLAGQPTLYSPRGLLAGDELDLIELPGNSLFLELLLPADEVKIADTWHPSDNLLAALLGIDAVSKQTVECTLSEVQHDQAIVNINGALDGAIQGVTTTIELKAKYRFDMKLKQITSYVMAVREKRSIGHVGPGLDVTAKLRIQIDPLETSEKLSDQALADVKLEPRPELTRIEFDSTTGGFKLEHERRWHPTDVQPAALVLRMIDRGELVAQCNVTSLAKLPEGKQDNLADFRLDVQHALGQSFVTFGDVGAGTNSRGFQVLHAYAEGKVQDLDITWRYYLVSDKKTGRRMAFAFTLEKDLLDRLGNADQELLDHVALFEPVEKAAAKPAEAKRK